MKVDQKLDADSINKETLTASFHDLQHTLLTRKNSGPAMPPPPNCFGSTYFLHWCWSSTSRSTTQESLKTTCSKFQSILPHIFFPLYEPTATSLVASLAIKQTLLCSCTTAQTCKGEIPLLSYIFLSQDRREDIWMII